MRSHTIIALCCLVVLSACTPEQPPVIAEEATEALNQAKDTAAKLEQNNQEMTQHLDEASQQ